MSFAQNDFSFRYSDNSKGVVYDKETTIDIRTHTNGFLALAVNFGKIKTYYKTKYYHFEIGEIKHNKEFRSRKIRTSNISSTSASFIYGKQNNFFVLRGGLGTKRYLTDKAAKKGLAVGINYEYGPSLGILKPYYVEVKNLDSNNSSTQSIRFSEETAESFLKYYDIEGHSGLIKGFGEASIVPGLNGKFGLHLDWGAFDEFVKAIEVGVMADIYFKKIPIMVEQADNIPTYLAAPNPPNVDIQPTDVRNRPFFINLYISLQLGKRS